MASTSRPARAAGRWADVIAQWVTWGAASLIASTFCVFIGHILYEGLSIVSWEFLTASPSDAGRRGGIFPIIVSTLAIVGVCMSVSVPVGLGASIFLAERARGSGRAARLVRRSLDVLAGIPSIVFGLFGNAFFSQILGLGFSILSGGLTLSCMVLPILIRSTEQGLRMVPEDERRAAAALGLSRTTTVRHVLLPAAAPGLIVGLVLGIGRAAAETAALIFTSGYVDRMPTSPFDSGRALSVHIYDLSMNVPGGNANAYGSAVVLLVILLALTTLASSLTQRFLHRRVSRLRLHGQRRSGA